ncbi:MAG: hypothetical protein ABIH23_22570 [bacterium]
MASVEGGNHEMAEEAARAVLSLDVALEPLHQRLKRHGGWDWLIEMRLGRFLKSPTLFEDCCKMLFTTNTNWPRTVQMAKQAVEHHGAEFKGLRAFPTPQVLSTISEPEMRESLGCGFRARYVHSLCSCALAEPSFFLADGWASITPAQFTSKLDQVKGLGPVSTAYLARMYSIPQGYAVDSYVQRRCRELWGVTADEIGAFLLERYRGLEDISPTLLWFELTRHWHSSSTDPLRK